MKARLTDGIMQLSSLAQFCMNDELREIIVDTQMRVRKKFKIKLIGFNG